MKIVYTVEDYYPNMGGVQTVTQKQAEAFAAAGHEVVVICGRKQEKQAEEIYQRVRILRVDAYNKIIMNIGDKAQFRALVEKECGNADILITVCLQSFATNWILGCLGEIKCRKVLYLHGISDFESLSLLRLGFVQYGYRRVRKVYWKCYYAFKWKQIDQYDAVVHIHESDGSLDYVKKHGYEKNYVIYNAVEGLLFESEPYGGGQYFVYVANYTRGKNQKELLRCFYMADIPCGLVLIGGQDNACYQKLIKEKMRLEKKYGKRNVKILHHVERSVTISYIKHALATVMTSKAEVFPITILETMAAGNPFICSDVGVVSSLPGGIIYHGRKELIQSMRALYQNPDYALALGKKGKEYAENHLTMESHMSGISRVLREIQGRCE